MPLNEADVIMRGTGLGVLFNGLVLVVLPKSLA